MREPAQIEALAPRVDGVIVGSALVRAARTSPEALGALVAQLRAATKH